MKFVDLHVHSNASDGTFTPSEVVALAAEKGLAAIALTDHDTIDGLSEAQAAAVGLPIEIIPELNSPVCTREKKFTSWGFMSILRTGYLSLKRMLLKKFEKKGMRK